MQAQEFADALETLLRRYDNVIPEEVLRQSTRECRDDIHADLVAHGRRIDDPFFNAIVSSGVAILTFFESQFSVYVIRCAEAELIAQIEGLALVDTLGCKRLLASVYDKSAPDLVVAPSVCDQWLDA